MAFLTTEQGHIKLAQIFLENNTFWLGRGVLPAEYPGKWESSAAVPSALTTLEQDEQVTRDSNGYEDELLSTPVFDIVSVKSSDGSVTYTYGESYTLVGNSVVWDSTETYEIPDAGDTYLVTYRYITEDIQGLISEVDTMKASVVSYCQPASDGIIEAGGQKWTATQNPTKFIYLYFKYPSEISLGEKIYQVGIYVNREISTAVNEATAFSNVTTLGTLVFIDNIAPFTQTELVRQYVEVVLEF